ncbi:hypothetical protein COV19_00845 [Candidatus Woesearchaeota archaeon CG10_big_fil_rev_8_21_14_0_10_44_13]|nr:MAG: hypothetical protein COV19_00845 [Candidatus Woesearchaeota archaeon CG10_big_fil_rev_8_21_14_0_10_44_13]
MASLKERQDAIFNELENSGANSKASVVSKVDDFEDDSRICLTMVYFLPDRLKEKINQEIINPLKKADPSQYYYLLDSFHVTINNVKVIADPPNFTASDITTLKSLSEYIKGKEMPSFEFSGLLKTIAGVSVKGYPDIKTQDFILGLRERLSEIGVGDDKRYILPDVVIGNITLCRFYNTPNKEFLKAFEKIKSIGLDKVRVDKISLISTNAACSNKKTKILAEFRL